MPADQYWRIDNGQQQYPLDGHMGPEETLTPGESYGLSIVLTSSSDSSTGEWPGYVECYQTLIQYGERAGLFALHEPMGGGVTYTETHDGAVPAGSLLVALRPPVDSETGRGMWGLVSSVTDATTLPSALCQFEMELTHLAQLDGYSDFPAVREALEREGIGLY